MFRVVVAFAGVISLACVSYLMMSPMKRSRFFLTQLIGKKLFPRLGRDQWQQRLVFCAGTILGAILSAGIFYFVLVKYLNRR